MIFLVHGETFVARVRSNNGLTRRSKTESLFALGLVDNAIL
jgi:hypothetical protein